MWYTTKNKKVLCVNCGTMGNVAQTRRNHEKNFYTIACDGNDFTINIYSM